MDKTESEQSNKYDVVSEWMCAVVILEWMCAVVILEWMCAVVILEWMCAVLPGFSEAFPCESHMQMNEPNGSLQPRPSSSGVPVVTDPMLLPLLKNSDDDFPPVSTLLERVAKPANKVAGSQCPALSTVDPKGKGKARADNSEVSVPHKRKTSSTSVEPDVKKNTDDLDGLLNILEELLPIGGKAWATVEDSFSEWAHEHNRPTRSAGSLGARYRQLVRTMKPTGNAECPPHIERVHHFKYLMNKYAGTRDLDDNDIADIADDTIVISSNDDDNDCTKAPKAPKTPVPVSSKAPTVKTEPDEPGPLARHAGTPASCSAHTSQSGGLELLNTISQSLDPHLQAAHDDKGSACSLHTTQILSLSNQLRDTQSTINTLHDQLQHLERECNAAECRADRAELQMEMAQMGWWGLYGLSITIGQ
ncbi:hypothetical protein BV22DRAFT_1051344 [Leucogyrophana mollusca]|uniref:Uncharacterized protein n=1 Tax=Leucogyrophana mollusca TaxID=85980 RepID=A0ACB8B2R8_9AGAM|nr:hypothetical protein BV22DRAFT_1051344 [Leucogyrophana mollusca]